MIWPLSLFKSSKAPGKLNQGPAGQIVWADAWHSLPEPGITTQLRTYYSAVAGICADLNSVSVSQTPLRLFRGKGREGDPEVLDHPLITLMDRPNPRMGRVEFLRYVQLYLELCGSAYLRKVGGVVMDVSELWPLQPHLMSPFREGGETQKIIYWLYNGLDRIELKDLIVIRNPDPLDPYSGGSSPVRRAWQAIALMDSDFALQYSLVTNQSRYQAIICPADKAMPLTTAQQKRLAAFFKAGVRSRAGTYGFTDIPIEIKSNASTSRDMEGSERFQQLREVILSAFGVPPALFQSFKSRAELEAAMEQYSRLALDSRCDLLSDFFNRELIPQGTDLYFKFDKFEPTVEGAEDGDAADGSATDSGKPSSDGDAEEDQDA